VTSPTIMPGEPELIGPSAMPAVQTVARTLRVSAPYASAETACPAAGNYGHLAVPCRAIRQHQHQQQPTPGGATSSHRAGASASHRFHSWCGTRPGAPSSLNGAPAHAALQGPPDSRSSARPVKHAHGLLLSRHLKRRRRGLEQRASRPSGQSFETDCLRAVEVDDRLVHGADAIRDHGAEGKHEQGLPIDRRLKLSSRAHEPQS